MTQLQRPSISRFDLTVVAVLATCALLVALMAWRSTVAADAPEDLRFLYLSSDEQGRNRLYLAGLTPDGALNSSRPLTDGNTGVWDFATSPDGETVVYSALSDLGLSDLWMVSSVDGQGSQFLSCPEASCSNARFSPDGRLLAFTQRNMSEFASAFFSPPRLWMLDTVTKEAGVIFPDTQQLALEPRWSPDGAWLSYISPDPSGLGVINLTDGETALYPNSLGEPGVWHPQQNRLITVNTWLEGEEYVTHLIQIDVVSGESTDLSGEGAFVNDSGAGFSPDGEWIAFRRKVLRGVQESRGKQIWIMHSDGSEARPLTADADVDYGNPIWSPDGRYLLSRRFPLLGSEIVPSLWLIDVQTGEVQHLLEPADQPMWIP